MFVGLLAWPLEKDAAGANRESFRLFNTFEHSAQGTPVLDTFDAAASSIHNWSINNNTHNGRCNNGHSAKNHT